MTYFKNTAYRQRGISMYGWLVLISLFGFLALVGMRSMPVYVKYFEVVNAMEWAAGQPELQKASPKDIRFRIQKRFDTGYVTHITAKDIKIKRAKDGRRFLEIKYDQTVPFVYNAYLLFKFHNVTYMKSSN